jgi:di/tricarboxylate transporter
VAALLSVAVAAATRLGVPTSRVLMPLAFAGSAGGMLTLSASPVNVIVSTAAEQAGLGGFAFLEFAFAGVPLVAGTILLILWLGPRVLPERNGASLPVDLSQHSHTLVEQYRLEDGLHLLRVRESSPLIGAAGSGLDFAAYPDLRFVGLRDGSAGTQVLRTIIAEGDLVMVRGEAESAARFAQDMHLSPRAEGEGGSVAELLIGRDIGVAEVVIPPRSALIGRTVFPGMVTSSGNLMVLAIQRGGVDLDARPEPLMAGDHLLVKGTWRAFDEELADPQVLVVQSPELMRRQSVALGPGAPQAIAIMGVLVLLLATGLVPPAVAGISCAIAMVLTGVLTVPQVYRDMDWNTVLLLAGMIPLSTAITQTGAADLIAQQLLGLIGDGGPRALLAGLFVLTVVLGQLISNTATALIIAPIAIATAQELGISPMPVLMSIAVAAAASFLTPVATPTNLMVMGPGGYRFGDYWKLGLPVTAWFFVVAVWLVPIVWPLSRP